MDQKRVKADKIKIKRVENLYAVACRPNGVYYIDSLCITSNAIWVWNCSVAEIDEVNKGTMD